MARFRRLLFFFALAAPLVILALALARPSAAAPNAILIGQLFLQGRTDHSGATIFYNGAAYTYTNPEGEFALAVTTGAPAVIRAKHPGYLSRQYTIADPRGLVAIPPTTLRMGDVDGDDDVDLNDLLVVVQAYGSSPPSDPRADLNADGRVSEIDLLAVVNNYGFTGPLPWLDEGATPTPTLAPTGTVTPTLTLAPTGTITPTATMTATVTVTPTVAITPTMTVTATTTVTPTVAITATTTVTATAGTPTVITTTTPPAPIETATSTPIAPPATDTPAPPTPVDTPPASVTPTGTPTPTATPAPG